MKFTRIAPISILVVLALLATPVAAQSSSQSHDGGKSGATSTTLPAASGADRTTTTTIAPPPVDQEIAAVLENERKAAAVDEAKLVAAAEQAAAEAVIAATNENLAKANAALEEANATFVAKQALVAAATKKHSDAKAEAKKTSDRLTDVAVQSFMASGSERDPELGLLMAVLNHDGFADASLTKELRDSVVSVALADLDSAREVVRHRASLVNRTKDAAAAAKKELDSAAKSVAATQSELDEAQQNLQKTKSTGSKSIASAMAEAPSLKSTELSGGLQILGDPLVPAKDLADFARKGGNADPSIDLDALAAIYIAEGKAEGVRSDVAWVQSIIETGWFSFKGSMVRTNDYNYAGIGACDSCSRGLIFDSMLEGVRSQIQLLRTYASRGLRTSDLANPPPLLRPESSFVRGCCKTWMKLSGVWATGPGYGVKILTLYNQLLAFAASRRAL